MLCNLLELPDGWGKVSSTHSVPSVANPTPTALTGCESKLLLTFLPHPGLVSKELFAQLIEWQATTCTFTLMWVNLLTPSVLPV